MKKGIVVYQLLIILMILFVVAAVILAPAVIGAPKGSSGSAPIAMSLTNFNWGQGN